jgi:hypothetical protein
MIEEKSGATKSVAIEIGSFNASVNVNHYLGEMNFSDTNSFQILEAQVQ